MFSLSFSLVCPHIVIFSLVSLTCSHALYILIRTYKVYTTAISSDPSFAESEKSNELIVNTQSENYQKLSPRSSNKSNAAAESKRVNLPTLDVVVSSCYDDALEIEWQQPLFSMSRFLVFFYQNFDTPNCHTPDNSNTG